MRKVSCCTAAGLLLLHPPGVQGHGPGAESRWRRLPRKHGSPQDRQLPEGEDDIFSTTYERELLSRRFFQKTLPPLTRREKIVWAFRTAKRQHSFMIKKYPWHFIFALFILISLANIFQKLKWSRVTDMLGKTGPGAGLPARPRRTARSSRGDICSPSTNTWSATRSTCCAPSRPELLPLRDRTPGHLKNIGVDIDPVFTPFSYYILVFVGILSILLTLGILNIYVKQASYFPPPQIFFVLSLTLSGFLIFSPTGDYGPADFLFLTLDTVSYYFLPGRVAAIHAAVPAPPPGLQEIQRQFPLAC